MVAAVVLFNIQNCMKLGAEWCWFIITTKKTKHLSNHQIPRQLNTQISLFYVIEYL